MEIFDLFNLSGNRGLLAVDVKNVHENRHQFGLFPRIGAYRFFNLDDAAVDGSHHGLFVVGHFTSRVTEELRHEDKQ